MGSSRRLLVVQFSLALLVGSLVALQARVNGALAIATGHSTEAAFVSFASGLALLTVLVWLRKSVRDGLRKIRVAIADGTLRWWQLLGGLLGGAFVAVQSAVVPLIGVAFFSVAVVAGQVTNSLVVDRWGLGPSGHRPISLPRVTAAVLALIAVVLATAGSPSVTGTTFIAAVVAAFAAGLGIAIQQALNGRVGATSGSAWAATWMNFVLGTMLLGGLIGVLWAVFGKSPGALPSGPWWLYIGGLLGVAFIAAAAWVVQGLGVLYFALFSITGQLVGALILDVAFPLADVQVRLGLVAAVAVAILGLAIGVSPAWRARGTDGHLPKSRH